MKKQKNKRRTPVRTPKPHKPFHMPGGRYVVSVDGLAGSGKTTLAKLLAKRLKFIHFSSGLLYRAVGYLALREKVDVGSEKKLCNLVKKHSIRLVVRAGSSRVLIDGRDLTRYLHTPEVSEATSKSSTHRKVRALLCDAQREAFHPANLVAEGRDMGTVIFPDATLKFFIVANQKVRVERRIKQLDEGKGTVGKAARVDNLLKQKIKIEITERDSRDSKRKVAPTKPARDAIIIDNSRESLTKVLKSMYDAVAKKGILGISKD